jgi:hypothetical protein
MLAKIAEVQVLVIGANVPIHAIEAIYKPFDVHDQT